MAVDKLTYPAKENAVQEKVNEIIDELGTSTGANIDLSNLSATGEAHFQAPLVSGTSIKTINNTSLLGSGNIAALQNTATLYDQFSDPLRSLTINGTPANNYGCINIGDGSSATESGVAVGVDATASGKGSLALGGGSVTVNLKATASANYAIQIGAGTNSTAKTLSVGFGSNNNYQLLDGTTGYIPNARINMDTVPGSGSTNAITSGAVYTALTDKVNTSGDTMTGGLALSYSNPQFSTVDSDITRGTAPAADYIGPAFRIKDSNGSALCGVDNVCYSDNANHRAIRVWCENNGGNGWSTFETGFDSSGNTYCTFPNTTCVDGQWVNSVQELVGSVTINGNSTVNYTYTSLSTSYNYEVLLSLLNNGNGDIVVYSDLMTSQQNRVAYQHNSCSIILPVSGSRKIYIKNVSGTSTSVLYVRALAYRRIGSNS